MNLNSLPDLVLLEVFAKLPPAQLLECRAVCRRWRALALEGRAWRDCRVSYDAKDESARSQLGVLRTVLRLAPCLGELDISHLPLPQLLSSTRCRIHGLVLHAWVTAPWADSLISVLENQAALRGLSKRLTLHVSISGDLEKLAGILKMTCTIRCEDLTIWDMSPVSSSFAPPDDLLPRADCTEPCLRRLSYRHRQSGGDGAVFKFLLSAHRYALKDVEIQRYRYSSTLLEDLADLGSLERLACPLVLNLDKTLLACRRLMDVTLELVLRGLRREVLELLLQAGKSFLMDAAALRRLCLISHRRPLQLAGSAVDLVSAAASSALSQLRELDLTRIDDLTNASWEQLLEALPGLPRLRVLCLGARRASAPPLSFLRGLRAQAAPALRTLRISVYLGCLRAAPEGQIRGLSSVTVREYLSELRRLLRRTPALHITALKRSSGCLCWERGNDCWEDLTEFFGSFTFSLFLSVGLYAHDETEKCEHHALSKHLQSWMRMV